MPLFDKLSYIAGDYDDFVKEDKKKRWKVFHEYFDELKGLDKKLYNKIRHRSLACFAFNLPGYGLKSFASKNGYKVFQKRLKLG